MPLLLWLTIAALTLGCAGPGAGPATGADIRGTITSLHYAPAASDAPHAPRAWMLVEGAREPDTRFDRAAITLTKDARLFVQHGPERRVVDLDALQIGQRVEVRFSGPVRESYPVQATASEVVILQGAG